MMMVEELECFTGSFFSLIVSSRFGESSVCGPWAVPIRQWSFPPGCGGRGAVFFLPGHTFLAEAVEVEGGVFGREGGEGALFYGLFYLLV